MLRSPRRHTPSSAKQYEIYKVERLLERHSQNAKEDHSLFSEWGGSVGRLVLIFEVLKELVERASLHVFKTSQ